MEKVILKSMVDFVLEQNNLMHHELTTADQFRIHDKIHNLAIFLKQPLNLGMFVPAKKVNGVWVVLEKPTETHEVVFNDSECLKEYQEAKDRVLFEGFKYDLVEDNVVFVFENGNEWRFDCFDMKNQTIESFTEYTLELTSTAKKQITI